MSDASLIPCPFCRREIDTQARITGDTVWCACGALLRVQHEAGATTHLVSQGAPIVEGALLGELARLQRIEAAARAHIKEWDGGDTSAHETRQKLREALGEVKR